MYKILNTLSAPDRNRLLVINNNGDFGSLKAIMEGNNTLNLLVDNQKAEILTITLGGVEPKPLTLPAGDIVLNSICDPDTNGRALHQAVEVFKDLSIPVVNPPQLLLKTTREQTYEQLNGIQGLRVPKAVRITPTRLSDVPKMLKDKQLDYPYIFRSTGEHGGEGMALINDESDLEQLEQFAFDGRSFYAIEFVDFQSDDGLYRKYRMVIIDGKFYPRHLIISKSWNIHSETRAELMESDEKYKEEELAYLNNPHPALAKQCEDIYTKIPLDFVGVDCHINDKGEMLIFEVNACMRIVADQAIEYQKPFMDTIKAAFNAMLEKRIASNR